jgi:hypothetical protein
VRKMIRGIGIGVAIGATAMALLQAAGATSHRPGLHATPPETGLIHWGTSLARETNELRDDKCLSRLEFRPMWEFSEGLRRYVVRQRLEKRESARNAESRCVPTSYLAAARYVQAAFPGTYGWLFTCAGSEGGFRGFIMNRQGSGAGGWLQFMRGTFYAFVDEAIAVARARGLYVPSSARSWYSPLGQALTGAYMRSRGLSYHWAGSGC